MRIRQRLLSVVGIFIASLCLIWVIQKMDWQSFLLAMARVELSVIFLCLFLAMLHGVVLAWKWQWALRPSEPGVKFWDCFWSLRLGFFFNGILPAKLGEAIRVWFIHRRVKIPVSTIVGCNIADRFLDFMSMGLIFFIALSNLSIAQDWIPFESLVAIPILVLFVFWGIQALPASHDRPRLNLLLQILKRIRAGFSSATDWRVMARVLLIASIGWGIHLVILSVLGEAMSLHLDWAQWVVMMVGITLASALPSAPSNVGTFEFAGVFVLTHFFKLQHEESFVVVLLYHFIQLIPTWILGLIGYFIYQNDLRFELKRLRKAA